MRFNQTFLEYQQSIKKLFESASFNEKVATLNELGKLACEDISYIDVHRKANKSEACHYFQKAADLGHADAQYTYGSLWEQGKIVKDEKLVKKDNQKAVVYYCQAALQGVEASENHIKKINPSLNKHLKDLRTELVQKNLLSGHRLIFSKDDKNLDVNNQKNIVQTITAFNALMNFYQYFKDKKASAYQHKEKAADFKEMLDLMTLPNSKIHSELKNHKHKNDEKFLARKHLCFFTGSQVYHDLRSSNIDVLAALDPVNLKSAATAFQNAMNAEYIGRDQRIKQNNSC